MKIRAGFVSNSSSASFLLTIDVSKEDIIQLINEDGVFLGYDVISLIEERIEDLQKILDLDFISKIDKENSKERIKSLSEFVESNFTSQAAFDLCCNIFQIEIENEDPLKMKYETPMYNSSVESSNKLINEILLVCAINGIRSKLEISES